jgi:hypothetical protein
VATGQTQTHLSKPKRARGTTRHPKR